MDWLPGLPSSSGAHHLSELQGIWTAVRCVRVRSGPLHLKSQPSPTEGSGDGGDLAVATMSTNMEAHHHGEAPQPTEFGSGARPPLPSSALVLRRSGSECLGSSSFIDPGPVELPERPSDDRVPLPAPPPPVPAR